jgi:hypothetical protein
MRLLKVWLLMMRIAKASDIEKLRKMSTIVDIFLELTNLRLKIRR